MGFWGGPGHLVMSAPNPKGERCLVEMELRAC